MDNIIEISYFIAAILFILGLKRMSSPVTARGGIVWAGVGMLVATLITFFYPGMENYLLMTVAIAIGGGLAFWSGKQVAMTDMPQMIALYNGMGGGAAAAVAAVVLLQAAAPAANAQATDCSDFPNGIIDGFVDPPHRHQHGGIDGLGHAGRITNRPAAASLLTSECERSIRVRGPAIGRSDPIGERRENPAIRKVRM